MCLFTLVVYSYAFVLYFNYIVFVNVNLQPLLYIFSLLQNQKAPCEEQANLVKQFLFIKFFSLQTVSRL